MSTILAYGNIGEETHFSDNRATVYDIDNKRIMIDALIFNREELCTEGMDESLSDSLLLYELIERDGLEILKQVNGDFAGAVFDKESGKWTLFRDHLGVRPLYYYADSKLLVIASDMRDIAYISGVHLIIDEEQLWLNFSGYSSQNLRKTDFKNIRCVCPGSITEVEPYAYGYEIEEKRYFIPGMNKVHMDSDEEYISQMRSLVEDSIRRRISVIDGTVGAELSGGLDSSVIDILIKRMKKPLRCISWRCVPDDWPVQPHDERIVIHDVCEQEGIKCDYIPENEWLNEEDFNKLEPPFSNTRTISTVAKIMSRNGIKFVFSGQGGDEGVSHRASVLELWHSREYKWFFREIWNMAKRKRLRYVRFLYYVLYETLFEYPKKFKPWTAPINASFLLTDAFKKKMKKVYGAPLLFGIDPQKGFENGGLRHRTETAAYQSEQYGVQYLYPFEDYRVFDYAVSIPRHLYLRNGVNRWIYRQAFEEIMPQSLQSVNYKDYPSLRNGEPDNSQKIAFLEAEKEKLIEELDSNIWSEIIDFETIEKLLEIDIIKDDSERTQLFFVINSIRRLIMIQRMINKNE